MTNYVNPTSLIAAAPMTQDKKANSGSWFEAMAQAWGQTLDSQADRIQADSNDISGGNDSPSALTELTTQSLKMTFMSDNSHTSISSVGEALDTMARKQ
jgi:hypothetical protein